MQRLLLSLILTVSHPGFFAKGSSPGQRRAIIVENRGRFPDPTRVYDQSRIREFNMPSGYNDDLKLPPLHQE